MPHKLNAQRRAKIPTQKHRVTNWASYNESRRPRRDLTVGVSEEALRLWSAPRRTTRGGQRTYSDLADRDLPDLWHDLQATVAADPRLHTQHRGLAWGRDRGAGFLDALAPGKRPDFI